MKKVMHETIHKFRWRKKRQAKADDADLMQKRQKRRVSQKFH